MRTLALTLLTVSMITPLAAQTSGAVSLPKGLLTKEGNTRFFLSINRRFQGADASHIGTPKVWKSWAMRRDGLVSITTSGGTVDASLTVGVCNMSNMQGDFSKNNFVGATSTVFNQTKVAFPDWSKTQPKTPYPFNFTLPFSKVYVYLAKAPFLWDLTLKNGTTTTNQCDRDFLLYKTAIGAQVGVGCGSFNHTLSLQNSGPGAKAYGMQARINVTNAPPNANALLSVDFKNSNLTIGGWCSKIYAAPTFLIPLGKSDSVGAIWYQAFAVPYFKIAEGLKIYTQAVSSNSAGIVLSNGRSATMPVSPGTTAHPSLYMFASTTTNKTAGFFYGGTYVIEMK